MNGRVRSPSYPSTPLAEAVVLVGKIFSAERTNAVDREVAAKGMGYSGLSGKSAKVLADLGQYGLLERTGKAGVRVTKRAVEILHPDNDVSFRGALSDAAFAPDLFKRIGERFPDGLPSEAALRSYFIKEGFATSAIPPAIRAFLETCRYIEQQNVTESTGNALSAAGESQADQWPRETHAIQSQTVALNAPPARQGIMPPPINDTQPTEPDLRITMDRIWLGGAIMTRAQALRTVALINAMMEHLPPERQTPPKAESQPSDTTERFAPDIEELLGEDRKD